MDFVVGLSKTLGKFDPIWVVDDRLNKSAYFIPVRIEQLAKVYVKEIARYHGNRDYIIKWDSIGLDKDLKYEDESISILDRDVRKLRTKEIKSMKVQWKHRPIKKSTWKIEKIM
ncbi:uncharacterized protein LOC107013198 [Solanum pennellii]|uniref:Uncharacterized protein LOC107013198 n=1 Tax=Solanum pennellii TaxID=28526 RepID=A0ABM1GBG8_SOLPN|nr:uncharacterized protein LOC107013198 [Solanum pennellii]